MSKDNKQKNNICYAVHGEGCSIGGSSSTTFLRSELQEFTDCLYYMFSYMKKIAKTRQEEEINITGTITLSFPDKKESDIDK